MATISVRPTLEQNESRFPGNNHPLCLRESVDLVLSAEQQKPERMIEIE